MTLAISQDPLPESSAPPVIVIGGGPAGLRAAECLSARDRDVVVFSAEPVEPYNRVKLTPLLAGDVQFGDITLPLPASHEYFSIQQPMRVRRIDREARKVITGDGGVWPYSDLIIATGSKAHVPGIPGRELSGVFTFRDSHDTQMLIARSFSARKVAVIGGGLLGLEAARGMQRRGAQVTVVEHENRLMPRQLDPEAARYLQSRIEALGVAVRCGEAVAEITGEHRVTGLRLRSGEEIDFDTVIICTGVRANTRLAKEAGLAANFGIMVDDQMRTGDPHIYAVGECAEHHEQVYGLVGPALEHAEIAASAICGDHETYDGSVTATKLKVLGADVFSAGPVEQLEVRKYTKSHSWSDGISYRRIFITSGRITGAIGVGEWPDVGRVQQAVNEASLIYPWQVFRFRQSGLLWSETEDDVASMPSSAIVCNCTGVTCGRLRGVISGGASDVETLRGETGAGSVCGTCVPILEELIDAGGPAKPVRWFRTLLWLSGLAVLLGLANALLPRVPIPSSYGPDWRNWLWFDTIPKQWTGYILLGITLAAMVIGLRKRIRLFDRLGGFDCWRLVHLAIGVIALGGLFAHTGFRPGANLNFWLFASFCATLIFGAIAGLATGGDHSLRDRGLSKPANPARNAPLWLHILAVWPLPALLLLHVLVVYAF